MNFAKAELDKDSVFGSSISAVIAVLLHKRMRTTRLCCLPLLLAPVVHAGEAPIWIDLSGEWRMRDERGGDLGTVRLPGLARRSNGAHVLHLQRDVPVPVGADTSRLVLTLGSVSEAYEVRINRQLIGQAGAFNLTEPRYARPRSFSIPAGALQPGSIAHIDLRVRQANYASARRYVSPLFVPDEGPYLLTSEFAAPRNVAAANSKTRERAAGLSLASAAVGFTLAALALMVWAGHRSALEVPLLAGFLICEELARLTDAVVIFADLPLAIDFFASHCIALGIAFLVLFAARIAGVRSRWMYAVAGLPLAIRLVQTWHWWVTQGGSSPPLVEAFRQTFTFVYLFSAAVALWPVFRQFGTGRRTLGELAIPLLTAGLGLSASIRLWQLQDAAYTILGYRVHFFEPAGLLLAALITRVLLRNLAIDRARLAGEVEAARTVQQLLLSGSSIPAGVEAVYHPAAEVGGDFWQALPLADGSRLIVVGDVSGKGMKAAVLVALVTGAIRNRHSDSPAAIFGELNQVLMGALDGGFVTAFAARIYPDGRTVLANAGHPAPYLDGVEINVPPGLPLGLTVDAEYTEHTVPAGCLTLISDGVPEAMNSGGELFGFERTRAMSMRPAVEIAEAARRWGQNDDITVVTVSRRQE